MEMIRYDHKRMEFESALAAIVAQNIKHQVSCISDLEKPTTVRSDRGHEVGSDLLRCTPHRMEYIGAGPKGPAFGITSLQGP